MYKYAGIGSRSTPANVLDLMTQMARYLASWDFELRSGHADGADMAFEVGARDAGGLALIALPWPSFNGGVTAWAGCDVLANPTNPALDLASSIHPTWDRLSHGAKHLHARNVHQVLGKTCADPVDFVVCWTPDGAETEAECTRDTGGTATAIRLASRHGIPVFNLARPNRATDLKEWLRTLTS